MLDARSALPTLCIILGLVTAGSAQDDDILAKAGFGYSVAVSDGLVFVGEPLNNRIPGRVYVFGKDVDSGAWVETGVIHPASERIGNRFGIAVAAENGIVAASSNEGVHIFQKEPGGDWMEGAVLTPADPDTRLGESLAVSGGRLFATLRESGRPPMIEVFERRDGDAWVRTELWSLPVSLGEEQSMSLAVDDGRAVVGVPAHLGGRVHLYEIDGGGLAAADAVDAPTAHADTMLFGASVAFDNGEMLVGAPAVNQDEGAVFRYPRFSEEPVHQMAADILEDDARLGSGVAISGRIAILGARADLFGYGAAFIFERASESEPWTFSQRINAARSSGHESISGADVPCEDGKAAGFPCENVDIASFLSIESLGLEPGMQVSDVWGWTDPETGAEYAIVCGFKTTTFVDITDPNRPVVLGSLPATPGTRANYWRDAKTYKNYAYIVADNVGDHGLQIFDLTQLRDVENPPVIFEPTAHYDGFDSAHNIIINEETGFAYVVGINGGGRTCGGGSHILDLANPLEPEFVGCFAHPGTGGGQEGATHDSQCVVYHGPDERYAGREICIASNIDAISIADFTDKDSIIPVAVARYPSSSYVHQGWLSDDHRYFFLNDETDEIEGLTDGTRTLIWDLTELDDPVLAKAYISENKATDHNYYISGRYIYQSNYVSGLRILDISDPENPVEVGYFDTVPWGIDEPGYGGSWSNYPFFKSGTIVVTSLEEGVFFLKRTDLTP